MPFTGLNEFIKVLEQEGELIRIKEFVSPELEITEITDRITKNNGPALLFENNGTSFPLLINAFGSDKRMALALNMDNLDQVQSEIETIFKKITRPASNLFEKLKMLSFLKEISAWMPKNIAGRGSCQEIIMEQPDLSKLPVLKCWPYDGGPFITLPVVHTIDPKTGNRNAGMYRMQVYSKLETGMHWHLHKNSAQHFNEYKKAGKKMPVSVTLGGDPAYTYAATAPLPENIDEYILAGFLRKKKVKMVKCITNNIRVPEDVDFVIEGYVDPNEELALEGPFGDHTGFYSLADLYPKFHVTCISHRKNAVYPATIVGIPPQEDGWIGKATEKIFLSPIKMMLHPEITDIHMPVQGVFHNLVLFNCNTYFNGQAIKIMNGLWGAGQMMFSKIFIAVNTRFPLTDYYSIAKSISKNTDISKDIIFSKGPADVLEHASRTFAYGSKCGIDSTAENLSESVKPLILTSEITAAFSEITKINDDLIDKDISVVIAAISKNKKNQIRIISEQLFNNKWIRHLKFLIFLDEKVDIYNYNDVVWLTLSHIDPDQDMFIAENCLIIDGTAKSKELDDFKRKYPNVIVMDDAMVQKIDQKWDALGLGELITSPSLKYKKLILRGKASTEETEF